jgi:hypothetical protein
VTARHRRRHGADAANGGKISYQLASPMRASLERARFC